MSAMQTDEHVQALEREGQRFVALARGSRLDALVPSCPGWRLRDVVAHLGFVQRWAASYVTNGWPKASPAPGEQVILDEAPPDAELPDWAEKGHAALVAALRQAPRDLECWTFLPAPSPLAFWARRQAHETAVHCADVELAAGAPLTSVEAAFGAGGVDELLLGFLGRDGPRDGKPVRWQGTVSLEAEDIAGTWTVRMGDAGLLTRSGAEAGDARVRAGASDLYFLLWNRRPLDGIHISGRAELLDRLRERARVTWE